MTGPHPVPVLHLMAGLSGSVPAGTYQHPTGGPRPARPSGQQLDHPRRNTGQGGLGGGHPGEGQARTAAASCAREAGAPGATGEAGWWRRRRRGGDKVKGLPYINCLFSSTRETAACRLGYVESKRTRETQAINACRAVVQRPSKWEASAREDGELRVGGRSGAGPGAAGAGRRGAPSGLGGAQAREDGELRPGWGALRRAARGSWPRSRGRACHCRSCP